jgi:DNA-binding NtrC family response regulator
VEVVDLEVLVVDDDQAICELLAGYFRELRVPCATCRDGRAAIAALERSAGRYGLVITDIGMPGADGFAVLEAALAANPDAAVVLMTGAPSPETSIRAMRSGAYDYLPKPFALAAVAAVVAKVQVRLASRRERDRR